MKHLRFVMAFLLCAFITGPARPSAQPVRPKLVVVLVVDQMRADYVDRYAANYQKGLKRLTSEGAWFQNAAYPYMSTLTCVGHTTIGTGTLPYRHGIIQNAWYDRASSKSVTCTADPDTTEISYGSFSGTGDSARWMLMPSLAETIKKELNGRVVTISIKARSAIGLAGHHADSVTWLDERGAWQTSSAFATGKAPWVAAFIAANPIDRDAGKTWERLLPEDRYTGPDDGPGEGRPSGWTTTFPHPLGVAGDRAFYAHWITSPYADA